MVSVAEDLEPGIANNSDMMGYDPLYALVFASQVLLLSGVCPARVQALGRRLAVGKSSGVYMALNVAVALIGFALLAAMLSLDFFDRMTPLLLSIGAFFFLQLSTLASPGARWVWSSARDAAAPLSEEQRKSARLFDFVSPVAVVVALVAAGGYAAFLASRLSGADRAQMLKLGIFLLTQSLFAFAILSSFRALKQDDSPGAGTRHQSFAGAAPLLVLASIMISAYYFGKEGLAAVELPQLRPIMMSAFLQLVGVLLFEPLYQKAAPLSRSGDPGVPGTIV